MTPAELLRKLLAACTGHPTRVGLETHPAAFGRTGFWLVDYERTAVNSRTGEVIPARLPLIQTRDEFLVAVSDELLKTIGQWRREVYLLRTVCFDCFEMLHPLEAVPRQGHLFHAACA